ncbi:MAG: ATP-grasp domain-containing protein [Candidatus Pacebacteria bacterium]|nr:ATP-grasp domain-containing protein [Candidatus Paceibacterota bacterium]
MSNKSEIILLNANKSFIESFLPACSQNDIPCTEVKSRNCLIVLMSGTKNAKLYHNNSLLKLKNSSVFVRQKGHAEDFMQIICELFNLQKIPFTDKTNLNFSAGHRKAHQMLTLSHNNIPIPNSIICQPNGYLVNKKVVDDLFPSFPLVLKAKGARGSAVWKVETEKELLERMEEMDDAVLIQEYIPNTSDIRTLVFRKHIIGSIERSSTDGFYNNISKGGIGKQIDTTREEEKLCVKACELSGLDLGGVDFIRTKNGPVFLEVNKSPQLGGFTKTTNIDAPKVIVEILKQEPI